MDKENPWQSANRPEAFRATSSAALWLFRAELAERRVVHHIGGAWRVPLSTRALVVRTRGDELRGRIVCGNRQDAERALAGLRPLAHSVAVEQLWDSLARLRDLIARVRASEQGAEKAAESGVEQGLEAPFNAPYAAFDVTVFPTGAFAQASVPAKAAASVLLLSEARARLGASRPVWRCLGASARGCGIGPSDCRSPAPCLGRSACAGAG